MKASGAFFWFLFLPSALAAQTSGDYKVEAVQVRRVTEISGQVGYESLAHFTRTFKATVGVTPSDYRRSRGHTWRQPS